jgi:hypothetical protein
VSRRRLVTLRTGLFRRLSRMFLAMTARFVPDLGR